MIYPAVNSDLNEIIAIEKQVNPSPWTEQMFHASIASGDFWVLRDAKGAAAERVCAYLIGQQVADEASLLHIAVGQKYWYRGYGNHILSEWLKRLPKKIKKAWLEVRSSNLVAIKLYEKNGFEYVSTRKKYYRLPGCSEKEDALIFCLHLN